MFGTTGALVTSASFTLADAFQHLSQLSRRLSCVGTCGHHVLSVVESIDQVLLVLGRHQVVPRETCL